MATIQKILKDGEVVYPLTKPEAVIDEKGNDLETVIKSLEDRIV